MNEDRNPLPLLLVTEAIRELENLNDKNSQLSSHICNLGKKPGFVMVALIQTNPADFENLDVICRFIANQFSREVFNSTAKYNLTSNTFTLTYDKAPSWFQSLSPIINAGTSLQTSPTPQQFWFQSYAHFLLGVFCGAFLHFGYDAKPSLAKLSPLTLSFKLEELQETWEFSDQQ